MKTIRNKHYENEVKKIFKPKFIYLNKISEVCKLYFRE